MGFQSSLIFNFNFLPLLLVLEAFPNSHHLLTAVLGVWDGKGRIGAALRRGRVWGPCREAGLVEKEVAAPGCSGGRLCAPHPCCPGPGIDVELSSAGSIFVLEEKRSWTKAADSSIWCQS